MTYQILVLDGDVILGRMIANTLAGNLYQVRTTRSVAEALAAIEEQKPDLICGDLMMLAVNDPNLLQHQAKTPSLAHVPIIAISAAGEKALPDEAPSWNITAHLAKPFGRIQLLTLVNQTLRMCYAR